MWTFSLCGVDTRPGSSRAENMRGRRYKIWQVGHSLGKRLIHSWGYRSKARWHDGDEASSLTFFQMVVSLVQSYMKKCQKHSGFLWKVHFELSLWNRRQAEHPLGRKCIFTFAEMKQIRIAIVTSDKYRYECLTNIIIKNMTWRFIAPGGDYKWCVCTLFDLFDLVVNIQYSTKFMCIALFTIHIISMQLYRKCLFQCYNLGLFYVNSQIQVCQSNVHMEVIHSYNIIYFMCLANVMYSVMQTQWTCWAEHLVFTMITI